MPLWIQKLNPVTPLKRVVMSPDFRRAEPLVRELEERFGSLGEIIYQARNTIRIIPGPAGKIVVKRFGKIFLANRIVYAWIRPSKARRSFVNARELLRRGAQTPAPIAYTEQFRGGALQDSMYVYAYYAGDDNMRRVLKEKDYPDREALLCGFARYACSLLDKGIFHKDFSPGNILFEKIDAGYRFTLIDINRVQFGPVAPEKRIQVFRRLFADEDTLGVLATEYARFTGEDPAAVTRVMTGYSRRFIEKKTRKKKIKKMLGLAPKK